MHRYQSSRRGVSAILILAMLVPIAIVGFFTLSLANIQRNEAASQIAADLSAKYGANAIAREIPTDVITERITGLARDNWTHGGNHQDSNLDGSRVAVEIEYGSTRFLNNVAEFRLGQEPLNSVRVQAGVPAGIVIFGKPIGSILVDSKATVANVERDLCLVIDRSGSMTFDLTTHTWISDKSAHPKNKLAHSSNHGKRSSAHQWWWGWPHPENSRWAEMMPAVFALAGELDRTKQSELLSIVSYSSQVTEDRWDQEMELRSYTSSESTIEAQPTRNYSNIVANLERKYNEATPIMGGTNIGSGIDQASTVLTGPRSRGFAFKTMIVMTDGQHNVGRSPIDAARDAAGRGIEVFTVTFSRDADIATMRATAAAGNGKHFHAADGDTLRQIFIEIANTPPGVFIE